MPKGLARWLLLLEPLARTPAILGSAPGPHRCGVVKNTSTCCSPDASGSCRGWGAGWAFLLRWDLDKARGRIVALAHPADTILPVIFLTYDGYCRQCCLEISAWGGFVRAKFIASKYAR